MSLTLTGTGPLLRATVKHDARLIAPWIGLATALSASSVIVYPLVFSTQQDRAGLAAAIGENPALSLIFGTARDLTTVDGFNAWRSLALGGLLAALGAIFAVTRASRAQEDSGQAELFASAVMGRASRLMTAIGMGLLGSLLLGLVAGLVTILFGGNADASLLLGGTFAATGWVFTGVAAVTAQLGSDARTATSMAIGSLGVLFILRGFAYSVQAPAWTIWVNPLGWMTQTQPATGNYWWPLSLAITLTAIFLITAFMLQARRDFGQGAIAQRPGPARGGTLDTWSLSRRLNRGSLGAWGVAFLALGFVFGRLATSINYILGSNNAVRKLLASGATSQGALLGAFLVMILSLLGIISAIPGIQTMLKVRSEELADRVEPILATAVGRLGYYTSNATIALAAPTGYVLLAGAVMARLVSSAGLGLSFGQIFVQAAAVIPAVWTIIAISVTVIGARPQATQAAWVGVLVSFVLTVLGPTFGLPDWALAISPFWHTPKTIVGNPDLTGLLWVSVCTVLLLAVGFWGFRRRDLAH